VIVMSRPLSEQDRPDVISAPASVGISGLKVAAPPDEDIEGMLAYWWREMLGVVEVGLDDDFFSLGGHSLAGVRLLARIKKTYHVELDMATLLDERTVRQLASIIRDKSRDRDNH